MFFYQIIINPLNWTVKKKGTFIFLRNFVLWVLLTVCIILVIVYFVFAFACGGFEFDPDFKKELKYDFLLYTNSSIDPISLKR